MNAIVPTPRPLAHVSDWVFDLDNTLYPRQCNLFEQIGARITAYVMAVTGLEHDEARRLQNTYYRSFGTTLNGLMQTHEVDPDDFLKTVHAIDYSPVVANPDLIAAIGALPGRKFILTNGDGAHASAVLGRLGGGSLFEAIYDIRAMGFGPKPLKSAYEGFFAAHGIDPCGAAMFDDLDKNLVVPHEAGMATVQVVADAGFNRAQSEPWELDQGMGVHVHYVTDDLTKFLQGAI